MGGLFTGLLQGLGAGLKENQAKGEQTRALQVQREMSILDHLSKSDDPEIKKVAMAGLIELSQGKGHKVGFLGALLGKPYEENPIFQKLTEIEQKQSQATKPTVGAPPPSQAGMSGAEHPIFPSDAVPLPDPGDESQSLPSGLTSASPMPSAPSPMSASQPVNTPQAQSPINPSPIIGQPPPSQGTPQGGGGLQDFLGSVGADQREPYGMSTPYQQQAKTSFLQQKVGEKDELRAKTQLDLLNARDRQRNNDREDRQVATTERDAILHGYKGEDIAQQGEIRKQLKAMAGRASTSRTGVDPVSRLSEKAILDLRRRADAGENIATYLGGVKDPDRKRVAEARAETGNPRYDKDQGKALTKFEQSLGATKSVEKAFDEFDSIKWKGLNPIDSKLAWDRFAVTSKALSVVIGKGLGEDRMTDQDREVYDALQNPGLKRYILDNKDFKTRLNNLREHIKNEMKIQSESYYKNKGYSATPPPGKYKPGKHYRNAQTGEDAIANENGNLPGVN